MKILEEALDSNPLKSLITACGHLNEKNLCHRFMCLFTWSLAGGAVGDFMEPLGDGGWLT